MKNHPSVLFLIYTGILQFTMCDVIKEKQFTKEEYLSDFEQCVELFKNNHDNLYVYRTPEELEAYCKTQKSLITDNLSIYEFYNIITEVCAFPQCFHCGAVLSEEFRKDQYFPFKTHYDNGKLWIVSDQTPKNEAADPRKMTITPGSEVLSINGMKVEKIVEILNRSGRADGGIESQIIGVINQRFHLLFSTWSGFPEEYKITYIESDALQKKSNTFSSIPYYWVPSYPSKETSSGDQSLDFKVFDDDSTALIVVRQFIGYNSERREFFNNFLRSAFEDIQTKEIQNLIIDIRGNRGGDPFSSAELIDYLISSDYKYFGSVLGYESLQEIRGHKEIHFDGNIFVWIDGLDGSTSGHFISLIKYHDLATLIGETSGSTYFCSGNPRSFTLDHTKTEIYIGRGAYFTSVEGIEKGVGIVPDYEFKPSVEDILKKKDSILNFTLKKIRKNLPTKQSK